MTPIAGRHGRVFVNGVEHGFVDSFAPGTVEFAGTAIGRLPDEIVMTFRWDPNPPLRARVRELTRRRHRRLARKHKHRQWRRARQ